MTPGFGLYCQANGSNIGDLITEYAPLVKRIACHLAARLPPSVQFDDLIQAGILGLMEATQRYDATQGASFATFAEWRIRGTMLDEIRKGDWVPRSVHRKAREVAAAIRTVETATGRPAQEQEVAEQLGLSLAEYYEVLLDLRGQKMLSLSAPEGEVQSALVNLSAPGPDPAEAAHRADLLKQLAAAIDGLPERERLVLSLYYDEGLNLKEIAAVLRVSESRVSQLHSQALARLRARTDATSALDESV